MATILLQAAGSALLGGFGPVGAAIGQAAGALAGAAIDRALIGGTKTVRGHPLSGTRVPGADEGTGIARLYGTMRIGGTLFWATRFEETVTSERQGGKASGPKVESYRYFANFALGLCEGEIAGVRRVWADGKEIDTTGIELRVYRGSRDQQPDPLIEAKQGTGNTPAYRGLAYVVFERLPLDDFGNRIPVLQFEVIRPVGRLERDLRAVTIIPGSTEHGYDPTVVTERTGPGGKRNVNRNVLFAGTDWQASLDELQAVCPNLKAVALVTAWFGDDLRAGHCKLRPGVEVSAREDESRPWSVAGISRGKAYRVSTVDGAPAFGGTPDDASVTAAIRDIRNRGLKVFLYPFVLMDVPANNALPDPYGGAAQAAYPWRGRITCHPLAADGTAEARSQVEAFVEGGFGYRRMIEHYAGLAAAAGGVDGFIIGSEMRGLTRLRDETGAFSFVGKLVEIADATRAVLGTGTAVTYAADWSEYFGYHPYDGTGDVFFNLDPLWASASIDAVGIDNYMPLSDWRDGDRVDGNPDGFRSASDPAGLTAAIAGDEGFDWYYASAEDRAARARTPITDGLAGKPWVFRFKDLEGWWANPHHERVGGVERATPTAWVPKSKPFWFTELGCPAVDKGPNQPNVFPDPKSSESALPYFSTGARDDLAQRRFLEAHLGHWTDADAPAGMVDPDRIFAWTWDARPYPAFPYDGDLWSDGANWRTGHWLNGRLGSASAGDAIAATLQDHGFGAAETAAVEGDLAGYVQGDPASARTMIEPLAEAFGIDVFEDAGVLRFQSRARVAAPACVIDVLADREDQPLVETVRAQDGEIASEAVIDHYDPANAYESASARSRRLASAGERQRRIAVPAAVEEATASEAADLVLREEWAANRTVRFALSPAALALEPGDAVQIADGPARRLIVTRIEDGAVRRVTTTGFVSAARGDDGAGLRKGQGSSASAGFAPLVVYLDLPLIWGADENGWARAAAHARPWRPMVLSASAADEGYAERVVLDRPARIGALTAPLSPGRAGRFDGGSVELDLHYGALASAAEIAVLNGANALAVLAANGTWEVLQFCEAEEVAAGRWRLTRLLRGQAGTDDAMRSGAEAGAPVVVLDDAVRPLGLRDDERGLALNWVVDPVGGVGERQPAETFAGGLRAVTPLSPVHLKAARNAAGDAVVTWTRRGRIDADSWVAADIPLDEPEEGYRVDLLDGSQVVRSVEVAAPTFTYAVADETADFGARQAALSLRIRQVGATIADGIPASAVIAL